jgi:hypothetical protein
MVPRLIPQKISRARRKGGLVRGFITVLVFWIQLTPILSLFLPARLLTYIGEGVAIAMLRCETANVTVEGADDNDDEMATGYAA